MRITDTQLNGLLDTLLPAGANNGQLSLHSAFSATGANLIGAKTNATFASASGRSKALTAAVDIAVPSAATVRWIGAWDSTGATFKGMIPNGGTSKAFQLDLGNNRIYCEGAGLANDEKIAFYGDTVPGGLVEGTVYFVVGVTAGDPDYLQVAATQGGSAIDLTSQHGPGCYLGRLVEEVYASSGTHRVNSFTVVG
jgi:hypothetical protein